VLQGKKEYFSDAVSIEGTLNYGYFMPVYQENSDSDVVGMVFVGTNKQQKDAIINQIAHYDRDCGWVHYACIYWCCNETGIFHE